MASGFEANAIIMDRFLVLEALGDGAPRTLHVRDQAAEGQPERVLQLFTQRGHAASAPIDGLDIAILDSLNHPRGVKVYEGGRIDETFVYYLRDFVEGEPILDWARGRPLEEVLPVLISALEVLEHLHERGFLHLKLRRRSFLVTPGGEVRLIDPGVLANEHQFSTLNPAQSTPYTAPELAHGLRVDRRSDLYSVGAMICELLLDQAPPLPRAGRPRAAPEGLARHPSPLAAIALALVHDEMAARPRSAAEVIAALKALISGDESAAAPPSTALLLPRFCGRRKELTWLNAAVSYVVNAVELGSEAPSDVGARRTTRLYVRGARSDGGETTLATLVGARGSGKKSLACEFAFRLIRKGIEVLWLWDSSEHAGNFSLISRLIRRLLQRPGAQRRARQAPESIRRELLRFLPDLVTQIPPPASQPEDEGGFLTLEIAASERARILGGLSEFLIQEARAAPFILVINDVHELSELAVELLNLLARRVAMSRHWEARFGPEGLADKPVPLFIITTAVEDEAEDEDEEEADFELWHHRLPLGPLGLSAVRGFACSALDLDQLKDERAALLVQASGGRPGALWELLERLSEHRRQGDEAAFWSSLSEPERAPALVAAGFERRIAGLSEQGRSVLAALAFLGRPMPAFFLSRVAGLDRHGPQELRALLEARLLRRRGNRMLSLTSSEFEEAILGRYDAAGLEDLNRRIALALSEWHDESSGEDRLIECARQALQVGDRALIARFVTEAAGCFERIRADEGAADLYRGYLDSGAPQSIEEELEVRVRLAHCLFLQGRVLEGIAMLDDVLERSADVWPAPPRAFLCRRLAIMRETADQIDEAVESFERGEALLAEVGDDDDARELAALRCSRAELLLNQAAHPDDVAEVCERGLKTLREHAPTARGRDINLVRARLLTLLGQVDFLRDRYPSAEQLTRGALALQERYGVVQEAARSYFRLGNIELTRGRHGAAERLWLRSLTIRREYGDRGGVAQILSNIGLAAARGGRLEKARESILESLRIREEQGDSRGRAASLHNLGYIYTSSGRLQNAVAAYNECLALRDEIGDVWYAAGALNNLGQVLFALGETAEARDRLNAALNARREMGDRQGEAVSLTRLAEIDYYRGRYEKALDKVRRGQKLRDQVAGPEEVIDSLQVEACIDLGLGRTSAASTAALKACELAKSHGLEVQYASSLLLRGRILSALGEYDRAKSVLQRAKQHLQTIGDRRGQRCVSLELARVYVNVGLHTDAHALLGSDAYRLGDDQQDESLGNGIDRVRELMIQALIEVLNPDGDHAEAKSSALLAVDLCQRGQLISVQWKALRLAAAAGECLGEQDDALALNAEAQEIVEDLAGRVPPMRRPEFLGAAAVAAAISGDSPLASIRAHFQIKGSPNKPSDAAFPSPAVRTALGLRPSTEVTISRPPIHAEDEDSDDGPPQPQRASVDVKRLRSRPTTEIMARAMPRPSAGEQALREAEFATLARLNRKLLEQEPSPELTRSMLIAAAKLCHAERGLVGVLDSQGRLDVLAAHTFEIDKVRHPRNAFALDLARRCAADGEAIQSDDAPHDGELRRRSPRLGIGVRSALAVPIRAGERRGVLYLDHRVQRAAFNQHSRRVAEAVADQIGLGLRLEGGDSPTPAPIPVASEAERVYNLAVFSGNSPYMKRLYTQAPRLARGDDSLLIEGEPGSGKRILARLLHELGPRAREPFFVLDCRTISDRLAEAELYGQSAGAFENAMPRRGLLRSAGEGTLVIAGLWQATARVKERLMAALQARAVRPLGSDGTAPLRCRIVTLAPDLKSSRQRGRVERAMLALLSAQRFRMAPLRSRLQDLPFLADSLLAEIAGERGAPGKALSQDGLEELARRPWHHNHRELRQCLEQAWKSAGSNDVIRARNLPAPMAAPEVEDEAPGPLSLNFDQAVKDCQKSVIERVLDRSKNREQAAQILGIPRRKLNRLIKKLGIPAPSY